MFDLNGETLALIIIGYGFVASVLPVWLLLAPRDYLSTFLKVGTMALLAVGILIVQPDLKMPARDEVHRRQRPGLGGQPVPVPVHHHRLRRGFRFPRADRVGHHAENARKRAPNPDDRLRRHAHGILRGHHGDDRRLGAPAGRLFRHEQPGRRDRTGRGERRSASISSWGFVVTPDMMTQLAQDVGEKTLLSRIGGAPTLAVGMAYILSGFASAARP